MADTKRCEQVCDTSVFLRMPQHAWDVLSATLDRDSFSIAFDPALRMEIREAMEQVEEVAPQKAEENLRAVFDILYLDLEAEGEFYNPDKVWDADTLDAIEEIVRPHFEHLLRKQEDQDAKNL